MDVRYFLSMELVARCCGLSSVHWFPTQNIVVFSVDF